VIDEPIGPWIGVGVIAAIAAWWWLVYLPGRRALEHELEQREREQRAERLNAYREQARASLLRMHVAGAFADIVAGVGPKNLSSARADGYTPPAPPPPRVSGDPCEWCNAVELGASGRTCANCGAPRKAKPAPPPPGRPTLNPGTRLEPIVLEPDYVSR